MKYAYHSWQVLILIYHLHVLNPINLQVWLECLYKKHPSVIMCRVIWFTLHFQIKTSATVTTEAVSIDATTVMAPSVVVAIVDIH